MTQATEITAIPGAVLGAAPSVQLRGLQARLPLDLTEEERELLELLDQALIRRWVDALAIAPAHRVVDVADALWQSTVDVWRTQAPKLIALLQQNQRFTDTLGGVPGAATQLTQLPPAARAYVNAFARLATEQRRIAQGEAKGATVLEGEELPAEAEVYGIVTLLHALAIAGMESRVPPVVATALAVGFWARLRAMAAAREEQAYLDAVLRESMREQHGRRSTNGTRAAQARATGVLARVLAVGAATPVEDWAAVPNDASRYLDRYLYRSAGN